MLRLHQANFCQALQDFRQRLLWDAIGFSHILGRTCALVDLLSQMLMAISA